VRDARPGPQDRLPSTREILRRHGLRAKKSWGQNFLVDTRVQERIVAAAAVGSDDVVVEIGAGLGALTRRLVAQAGHVIAIEHDAELAELLEQELGPCPGLKVERADALGFDFAEAARVAGRPLVVVGNLPYQITSSLLFAITDAAAGGRVIGRAILMVQKEFAQRMLAGPGSKVYGRLSVMVQQQAEGEMLFHVGPGAFHPRPAVTSTVVCLRPRLTPLAPVRDPAQFAQVVKQAFAARRKMLRRALEPLAGAEAAGRALVQAGIQGTRRAEELSVAEFAHLADAFGPMLASGAGPGK
jgi:16S rRNA (adenine1518-N6/adenine1519-N6)-dimethyltransferase